MDSARLKDTTTAPYKVSSLAMTELRVDDGTSQ